MRKRLYISQRITGAQIFPLLTQQSIVGRNAAAAAAAECVVGGDVMGISSKAAPPPPPTTNSHAMMSLSSYSARSEMYTHRNYITLTAGATVMSLCSHHNQYVQALSYTPKCSPPLFWYVRGWCFGPTWLRGRPSGKISMCQLNIFASVEFYVSNLQ